MWSGLLDSIYHEIFAVTSVKTSVSNSHMLFGGVLDNNQSHGSFFFFPFSHM